MSIKTESGSSRFGISNALGSFKSQYLSQVLGVMAFFGFDASSFTALRNDVRAQNDVTGAAMAAVALVVGLLVAAIVAAFLLPIGLDEIVAVDSSNWSSGAAAMWDILDVIIVLAVFLFFIALALAAANRV